jgi:hypothetical protein
MITVTTQSLPAATSPGPGWRADGLCSHSYAVLVEQELLVQCIISIARSSRRAEEQRAQALHCPWNVRVTTPSYSHFPAVG